MVQSKMQFTTLEFSLAATPERAFGRIHSTDSLQHTQQHFNTKNVHVQRSVAVTTNPTRLYTNTNRKEHLFFGRAVTYNN